MKTLFMLLLTMSAIVAYPQCEGDIWSGGISTDLKGLTGEISYIAQETKVGVIIGSSLYLGKENTYDYVYDAHVQHNVYMKTGQVTKLYGSIHAYGTFKVIHEEYRYSLHILAGGVYSEDRGAYLSGGFELRRPINTKCLFIRGLYPYNFRAGILFQL